MGVSCNNNKICKKNGKNEKKKKRCLWFEGPAFYAGSDLFHFHIPLFFFIFFFLSLPFPLFICYVSEMFIFTVCVGQNVCDSVCSLYRAD